MRRLVILISVVVSLTIISSATAQGLGFNGVGAKAGLIMPEDPWDTGFFVSITADLGEITENLSLVPFVGYWKSNYSIYEYDLGLSNIQLGADVHYFLSGVPGLYAGGGLSLNLLSVEYPTFNYLGGGITTDSESETKLGFGFLAGYGFNVAGQNIFVEGKYNIISDFNTLELAVGIMFDLKK